MIINDEKMPRDPMNKKDIVKFLFREKIDFVENRKKPGILEEMKISEKSKKLAGVLEEHLPSILQTLTTPNQVGFLTISAIEISGDCRTADVFVNSIGGPKEYLTSLQKISAKVGFELAKKVPRQFAIQIRFKENQAPKNVQKINKLLS